MTTQDEGPTTRTTTPAGGPIGRRGRRGRGDDGVIVVILAGSIMAILLIAALLIDIGGGRNAKIRNSAAADAAVLAGASNLPPLISNDNSQACEAAWDHILANYTGDVTTAVPPDCSAFQTTCNPTTERTTTATIDRYTFELTNPVLSTAKLKGRAGNPQKDSTPCRRLALRVTEQRENMFTTGTTTVVVLSVARLGGDQLPINAPLIVTEPFACRSLVVAGTAQLNVAMMTTSGGTELPGIIAIDSNGSEDGDGDPGTHCTGSNPVIATRKANGVGQGQINVQGTSAGLPGTIGMYALSANGEGIAFNPDDVNQARLTPQPTANQQRVGTKFIERRYNCKPENGCVSGDSPHIDDLVDWLGGTGKPDADENGEFKQFSLYNPTCRTTSISANPIPAGNWWVDCQVGGNGELRFEGPGTVVFDQGVNMTGQGSIVTNCGPVDLTCDPATPMTLYFRDHPDFVSGTLGNLVTFKPGTGGAYLNETFVYMSEGTTLDMSGNSVINWIAPDDPTYPFDDLALWTESYAELKLSGTPQLDLEGTFFAPNAHVLLTGTADMPLQNSQFVVNTMLVDGTGTVTFKADPDRMTLPRATDPFRGATLIR